MTYQQALQYIESFINYERIPTYRYKESLKLERVKNFLSRIGNPQDGLSCIHVAGTKGKGSTCAFITYILRQAGYKVGLYTSPHLSDFRERIRILSAQRRTPACRQALYRYGTGQAGQGAGGVFEGMISKRDLARLVAGLKPAIDKYNQQSRYGPLSFFEVWTALAFVYFKEKKVDFAVLETGLGGRLDATNVVKPLACAITPISYEHTDKLGKTLSAIAAEKAGIIKSHQVTKLPFAIHQLPVISAPQEKEAAAVIRKRCRKTGAHLTFSGRYKNSKLSLLGRHQRINAALALAVIKALRRYHINVSRACIKKGLFHTLWPGRCEVISKKPLVMLDGAQNLASARALKKAVRENFSAKGARLPDGQGSASGGKYRKLILVLGVSKDKDIKGICNELSVLADKVILTRSNNPRAAKPEALAGYFKNKNTRLSANVKKARAMALETAAENDLILVTGSLFVVGEFRDAQKRYQ